jgi:hypothetical protein
MIDSKDVPKSPVDEADAKAKLREHQKAMLACTTTSMEAHQHLYDASVAAIIEFSVTSSHGTSPRFTRKVKLNNRRSLEMAIDCNADVIEIIELANGQQAVHYLTQGVALSNFDDEDFPATAQGFIGYGVLDKPDDDLPVITALSTTGLMELASEQEIIDMARSLRLHGDLQLVGA